MRKMAHMPEPSALLAAREHLARAEASFGSADGLIHLEEGLAMLEELLEEASSTHAAVARNIANTYAAKIYGRVKTAIEQDRALPEPLLEHYFKLVLAFDEGDFQLPADARALKITVVRRLIELYYEGHPAAEKEAALQQLRKMEDDEQHS
jgi:hypothetical protein